MLQQSLDSQLTITSHMHLLKIHNIQNMFIMFIPVPNFLLQSATANSKQSGRKTDDKTAKLSQTILNFPIHYNNKNNRDVHTLSNPVYSFSVKEKVGKGKQKGKAMETKIHNFPRSSILESHYNQKLHLYTKV